MFSLEEFMDWYAARFGAFTYFEDWSGFNVPSTAFEPFYRGDVRSAVAQGRAAAARCSGVSAARSTSSASSAKEDLKHELAHALFSTQPAYKKAVHAAMRGYDTSMLEEATRGAWAITVTCFPTKCRPISSRPRKHRRGTPRSLRPLRKTLRAIYREHARQLRPARAS